MNKKFVFVKNILKKKTDNGNGRNSKIDSF